MLSFGPFRLDPVEGVLWRKAEVVALRRKTFAVLQYLAERPRRLVTQQELLQSLWGDVSVSDTVVRGCIRELRRVLGEGFIETVVGRGYRFNAPVTSVAESDERLPRIEAPELARTPFVGRSEELDVLLRLLEAPRKGDRRLVLVSGELGSGKSALLDRFLERVGAADPGILVASGRCLERCAAQEAFHPLFEALARLCRGPRGEYVVELLDRHAPSWLLHMPGVAGTEQIDGLRARAQGATRGRMLREVMEALDRLTQDRCAILVIEDVQWCDDWTAALLSAFAQRPEHARLLVVAAVRSMESLGPGHPLGLILRELHSHRRADVLDVPPLTQAEVNEFLALRFPPHHFPSAFGQTISSLTGGNPLFVVTLVDELVRRRWIAHETGEWRLRASLEAVAARGADALKPLVNMQVDRLPGLEQRVLEAASLAGVEFTATETAAGLDLRADEVEQVCARLVQRKCFLRSAGSEAWPDGSIHVRYAFSLAAVRDVLAAEAPLARAQRLQLRMGMRLEAAYGVRVSEIAPRLAAHFEDARDAAKGARYRFLSGEEASRRADHTEAVSQFQRGLALLREMPPSLDRDGLELSLQRGLAGALTVGRGYADVGLARVHARVRELAERTGDPRQSAAAILALAIFHLGRAEYQRAIELSLDVERLSPSEADAAERLGALRQRAAALFFSGDLRSAAALFERIDAAAREGREGLLAPAGGGDMGAAALVLGAIDLWILGHTDRAEEAARHGVRAARSSASPFVEAFAANDAAILHGLRHEREAALAAASIALDLSQRFGLAHVRAEALATCACVCDRGDTVRYLKELKETDDAFSLREIATMRTSARLGNVAAACVRAGFVQHGLHAVEEGLAFARTQGERFWEAELLRVRGELLVHEGRRAAEECFQQALEIARAQGAKAFELRATISLGRLWQGTSRHESARQMMAALCAAWPPGQRELGADDERLLPSPGDPASDPPSSVARIVYEDSTAVRSGRH
jgi:DNA-binding winged helix-turn-helix (wHTH) protein/tetratricopeptide (TPR) repeat protein